MHRIELAEQSQHWKDRMAGWHTWKVHIPQCRGCGATNTFYTVSGTRKDAERLASSEENDYCEKCS